MEHPEAQDHARLTALAEVRGLPTPPNPPAPGECCERHCDPCVWDYYARALARYRERHEIDAD